MHFYNVTRAMIIKPFFAFSCFLSSWKPHPLGIQSPCGRGSQGTMEKITKVYVNTFDLN